MSEASTADWLAAVAAIMAAMAALAAAWAAFSQANEAKRSADATMFSLRYGVYESVLTAHATFMQSGKLDDETFNALSQAERQSQFLFSDQSRAEIEQLRFKMIQYVTTSAGKRFYNAPGITSLQDCDAQYRRTITTLEQHLHFLPSQTLRQRLEALSSWLLG